MIKGLQTGGAAGNLIGLSLNIKPQNKLFAHENYPCFFVARNNRAVKNKDIK
jgi:hypothetical protein